MTQRPAWAKDMPDEATLEAFTRELEALGQRTRAKMGDEDLAYLENIDRTSRTLRKLGRVLIFVALDPLTLGVGVLALAAGKQLNMIEVCHAVLHGTYDRFNHPHLHSTRVHLDAPLSEQGWRETHGRHHPSANVVGRDPDSRFGVLRQHELVPYRWHHKLQLLPLASNWMAMSGQLNLMVTGVADFYMRSRDDSMVLRDRKAKAVAGAHWRALSKAVPYYAKEFVLLPALGGPFFPKIFAANAVAELLRNLYASATVYSGHVSTDTKVFPKDARATTKGQWYWMQAAATANFEVPRVFSQLSGGLDKHIEHHFFPTLPPERIRAIAPEVRELCEKYGIPYNSAPWPAVLKKVLHQFMRMSKRPRAGSVAPAPN